MSDKTKMWLAFFAPLLIIAGLGAGYLAKNIILRQYDAARLAWFAHQIADADRVVGVWERSSVHLTLTGDDAKQIVRAVSSAVSVRMPDAKFACIYSATATFYRGTNVLGDIDMCNSLFLLKSNEPPFADGSGLLDTAVYSPLLGVCRT